MIDDVDFDDSPIGPGETRILKAYSNVPFTVFIRCFTKNPPPPGYRPCPACGSIPAISGQEIEVTADVDMFKKPGGVLEVLVRDEEGDARSYQLTVTVKPRESYSVAVT